MWLVNQDWAVFIGSPKLVIKQSHCIPVGCVLPAAVAIGGVSIPTHPGTRHPSPGPGTPGPGTLPRTRYHPRTRHSPPPRTRPPMDQVPPPVDRHSSVNILPCPKLRLRAVITSKLWSRATWKCLSYQNVLDLSDSILSMKYEKQVWHLWDILYTIYLLLRVVRDG